MFKGLQQIAADSSCSTGCDDSNTTLEVSVKAEQNFHSWLPASHDSNVFRPLQRDKFLSSTKVEADIL